MVVIKEGRAGVVNSKILPKPMLASSATMAAINLYAVPGVRLVNVNTRSSPSFTGEVSAIPRPV